MRLIFASTAAEFEKILLRGKYRIIPVLEIIICVCAALFFQKFMDYTTFPYAILNIGNSLILPLTIFMLTADSFSGEVENATIKCSLLRPVSRFKIFLSKIFAIALYVLLNLMAVCFSTLSISSEVILSYAVSIIPMLAFITLAAFISQLIDNSSLTMFANLLLYVFLQGVAVLSPRIGAMFFTSHLNSYKMFLNVNFLKSMNIFFLIASSAVLLFIGGLLLFERKEL